MTRRRGVAAVAAAAAIAAGAAAGCASFESEEVVLDLRVLAMRATLPEQVIDVDLANPPAAAELLEQIEPTEVCALVADPGRERRVRWAMTLCAFDDEERCSSNVAVPLASGIAEDPELAPQPPRLCGSVMPDGNLLGILLEVAEEDQVASLGGVEYGVSLVARGEDEDPALDQYAGKRLRVAPRIPDARAANVNPALTRLEAQLEGGPRFELAQGRCAETAAPVELRPRDELRIHPIEAEGAREVYVVPRLDGETQTLTEALTYQWLASAGGFSSGSTGGPRDVSGNPPALFTDYRAPNAEDLTGPTDVQLWIVQRDERFGSAWYQACVRVVP